MIVTLLVIVGSATLIGVVLTTLGLRGRRIDDHPVCARCRFDLSGAPEPRATCPECGRDVSNPEGIKVGQRRRRPRMLISGAAALAVSLLIWGVAGWGLWKGTNWNTHKPTGWLLFEARVGAPAEADAAISEVADRVISERPPRDARVRRFIDVTLAHQADHSKPWGDGWGKALDVILEKNLITEEQVAQVFRNAYQFEMDSRSIARANERVMVRLRVSSRTGSTRAPGSIWLESTRTLVNGVEADASLGRSFTGGRSSMTGGVAVPSAGAAEITVDWRYAFADSPVDEPTPDEWNPFTRTVRVDVIDAALSDGVGLRPDEVVRERLRKAVKIARLEARPHGESTNLQASFTFDKPPVDLAFDVFLRQGEREWRVGSAIGRRGVAGSTGFGPNVDGLQPGPVDIIFRGSESAVRRTIDMTSAWDGELIFENVPVLWPPAQPAPSPE